MALIHIKRCNSRKARILAFIILFSLILYLICGLFVNSPNISNDKEEIVIVVVACGDRSAEALNMVKSALIFNTKRSRIKIVVFCSDDLFAVFDEKFDSWRQIIPFTFEIHPLTFPKNREKEFRKLFKPCASQRLFLPSILKHIDSVIYMDSDSLFLSDPTETWDYFKMFNNSQLAAMAPEHEDRNAGWYNRFARHPFYGELGINSGICLMNLTRMREFEWEAKILPIYEEYKLNLVWGDQDIINILFFFHSEKLFLLLCEYNYRADHCMYMDVCKAASGIKILHGNRGYFHNSGTQPIFKIIYNAISEYQFETDPYKNIIKSIEFSVAPPSNSNCDKISDKFLFNLRKILQPGYEGIALNQHHKSRRIR